MANILHFDKVITKEIITVPNMELVIKDCRIYTIKKGDEIIGKFFTNLDLSYGKVASKGVTIEYKNRLFKKSLCFIRDTSTGEEVAQLHWSENAYNLKMRLDIPGQYQFLWEDISRDYVSFLQPKTWSTYVARLSNGPEEVIVRGKLHHKIIGTASNELVPLSGEIEFLEDVDPLLLICTLYMLETALFHRNNGT